MSSQERGTPSLPGRSRPPSPPDPGSAQPDSAGPPVAAGEAPSTGDAAIDAALAELDAVTDQPLARHIEAGERVQEVLRGRLADLGGA